MTERTRADRAPQNMAWLLVSLVGGLLVGVAVGSGCVTDDPTTAIAIVSVSRARAAATCATRRSKSCVPRMVNSCSDNNACTDPSPPTAIRRASAALPACW